MLRVVVSEIASAKVIPWEANEYGVAYVTKDGREMADRIGSKADAEALIRRVGMVQDTAAIFLGDIAAS
jgi:hypothetical protein